MKVEACEPMLNMAAGLNIVPSLSAYGPWLTNRAQSAGAEGRGEGQVLFIYGSFRFL